MSAVRVFVGPSLGMMSNIPPSFYLHGPARRGDLDALEPVDTRAVVLIDGFMVYDYPPSPQETARLVERGIPVIGAASLGALRAVELRTLGVAGVGWVYRAFLERAITSDDELIARLDPATGRAATVFLVNLRYAASQLVRQGAVLPALARQFIDAAADLHFEERTPSHLRRMAKRIGFPVPAADALFSAKFDIKSADARHAIQVARRLYVPQTLEV